MPRRQSGTGGMAPRILNILAALVPGKRPSVPTAHEIVWNPELVLRCWRK